MLQSRKLVIPRHRIAVFLGGLDVISAAAYVVNISPVVAHASTLVLKIFLLALTIRRIYSSAFFSSAWKVIFLYSAIIMSSILYYPPSLDFFAQYSFFMIHLTVSLLILRPELWIYYMKGVAVVLGGLNFLFIVEAFAGLIPTEWDRYTYFGGGAANLGAEIGAVGVVAALVSLRTIPAIAATIIAFYAVMLMQGRAALLVIIGSSSLRIALSIWSRCRRSGLGRSGFIVGLLFCAAASSGLVIDVMTKLMLINDSDRGAGTDFVGRGERWALAYKKFLENPIIGAGLGWYDRLVESSPHNFYLYGLSQFGMLSICIYMPLAVCAYRGWRANKNAFLIISPLLILTIFNDRFMNLNAYPFVMFVVLLSASCLPAERRRMPLRAHKNPLIPTLNDQNSLAHFRRPMDMMRHG